MGYVIMSISKKRRVGFLIAPFIGLLTLGLPKPSLSVESAAGSEPADLPVAPVPEPAETAAATTALALEGVTDAPPANEVANEPPTAAKLADTETSPVETVSNATAQAEPAAPATIDWQRARSFQLPARLAVNRQLNRPKKTPARSAKAYRPAEVPMTTVLEAAQKLRAKPATPGQTDAKIIEFPHSAISRRGALENAA